MWTPTNPLMLSQLTKYTTDKEFYLTNVGLQKMVFAKADYVAIVRGSGGCGGENGSYSGGAGGSGHLNTFYFSVAQNAYGSSYIGQPGKLKRNGGNGGTGHGTFTGAGNGGGGAEPTIIKTGYDILVTQGGAGGGGGGGSHNYGRYAGGGGGAGGGGYYRILDDGTFESVDGRNGGTGGSTYSSSARAPGGGGSGNQDFPQLRGGNGGSGQGQGGAGGGSGGGAGGGGGGGGSNHSSSWGGGGGGGAAGDPDAGGGFGEGNATNARNVPIDTVYSNKRYGIEGSYGIGGTPGVEGTGGFIYMLRFENITEMTDYGSVEDETSNTIDCGTLDKTIRTTKNIGAI